jgi:hypothetical protein
MPTGAIMKIMMFEGTPQELKEIKHFGFFDSNPHTDLPQKGEDIGVKTVNSSEEELTKEAVISALVRHGGLTSNQKAIVKAIYEHGKEGIASSEISKITGFIPSTIKATMRTIGKRVAHTKNWPDGVKAFDQYWTGSQNIYKLHSIMREVFDVGAIKL